MKCLHFLFCVIVLSMCALTMRAQTDSTSQSVQELQRVDVVADRQSSPVRASVPVQQIDRDRMRRLGLHTMTDALRHMAGITVRDYGGAGGMKTVSVRGIGARHTAVVYDGIALSDCQTGEIDLSRFSLDQLASLRLVIGDDDNIFQPARNQAAAATLHMEIHPRLLPDRATGGFRAATDVAASPQRGANPPFATEDGQRGESSLSVGSFGLVNPSIRLYLPSLQGEARVGSDEGSKATVGKDGGRLLFSAFADFFHADNDYPFTLHNVSLTTRERRTNSHMNAGRGELNLDWQPDDRNTLSVKAYYYNNHRRLPGIVHYYTNENHERLAEQLAFGQLRLRSVFSDQWALLVSAKYNWSLSDYQNRTPGSGLGDACYWQREAYASASLLYVPTRWLSLDYALDLLHNSLNSTIATYASHPHRATVLQGLAAKTQWSRLTVVARALLHYSHDSSASSGDGSTAAVKGSVKARQEALAPSVSLSYRLLPESQLYARAMLKRIFRLPTFNELYFYHIGAADLQPESATQFNFGLTWKSAQPSASEGLSAEVTLDAYANRVSEKIVAVPFNMFVWRIMNIGEATIRGLDLTANTAYRLNARHLLALSGNYSYQRAMNTTVHNSTTYRNQLPYTPLHSYCATASWENPWLNVAATLSGQTSRWTTVEHSAGTRIDPFATTDLSFWRALPPLPGGHKLRIGRSRQAPLLRLTLQNIFNRQYDLVAHYPMPGRSWRLQLLVPM